MPVARGENPRPGGAQEALSASAVNLVKATPLAAIDSRASALRAHTNSHPQTEDRASNDRCMARSKHSWHVRPALGNLRARPGKRARARAREKSESKERSYSRSPSTARFNRLSAPDGSAPRYTCLHGVLYAYTRMKDKSEFGAALVVRMRRQALFLAD